MATKPGTTDFEHDDGLEIIIQSGEEMDWIAVSAQEGGDGVILFAHNEEGCAAVPLTPAKRAELIRALMAFDAPADLQEREG